MKKILLVNPWIYDFAAYDLWMKPWGLLKISSILKKRGFKVFLADAMDRHHPVFEGQTKDRPDGTGKFYSEKVKPPEVLRGIPRKYRRYGIPPGVFEKILPKDDIDLVLVTSGMTYWYPGVFEAIDMAKKKYPGSVTLVGGTYATLCREHAFIYSGADHIVGNKDLEELSNILGISPVISFSEILEAKLDISEYRYSPYGVLRISLGCPFNCAYCAQKYLGPDFMLKDMNNALDELGSLYLTGIKNFAFYDDALLYDTNYFTEYLRRVDESDLETSFYTPNGLHARFLTKEIAVLMKKTGFMNPILSLEAADDNKTCRLHKKITFTELLDAIDSLKSAGYRRGEYTVYLMAGIPGVTEEDIEQSMRLVNRVGARVSLSEFSPIPGTDLFEDIYAGEPLLQNNSAFVSFVKGKAKRTQHLKDIMLNMNAELQKGRG